MNIRRFFVGRTIGFFVVVFVVGGFFLFNNYIYQEKQSDGKAIEPYRATLEGTYICLSSRDMVKTETEAVCEPGIKTDTDEYYAVNFFLMSQMHPPLEVGQRFSANGVMTVDESSDPLKWQQYDLMGIFSVTDSLVLLDEEGETYICDSDAIQCPDGSVAGREGPRCEFKDCSALQATSTQATTSLGESVVVSNITITPQEVVTDSRCPINVECVWAGTVEVRTTLATQVAHGEHVLTLGKPQIFGDKTVTLIEVLPVKSEMDIPVSSYQFTFLVSLK